MRESAGPARHRSRAVLTFAAALFFGSGGPCLALQDIASSELPSAAIPESRAAIGTQPAASPRIARHAWLNLNRFSVAVLVGSEVLDSWTTYNNLTHPKWICGYSAAFGSAVTYVSNDGKRYDPHTIQYDLCGPGPAGQLATYAYDVTRTGAFTETGWVTSARLASGRNAAGVIAWNVADDLGQMLVARYLTRRRGLIGRVAPGLNLARGLVHLDCGIQNIQFARHHRDASAWSFNVPNEAKLYASPRWWGRR